MKKHVYVADNVSAVESKTEIILFSHGERVRLPHLKGPLFGSADYSAMLRPDGLHLSNGTVLSEVVA